MGGAGSNGVLGFEPAVVARLAFAGLVAQGFFMFGMHAVAAFVFGGKETVGHAHVPLLRSAKKAIFCFSRAERFLLPIVKSLRCRGCLGSLSRIFEYDRERLQLFGSVGATPHIPWSTLGEL